MKTLFETASSFIVIPLAFSICNTCNVGTMKLNDETGFSNEKKYVCSNDSLDIFNQNSYDSTSSVFYNKPEDKFTKLEQKIKKILGNMSEATPEEEKAFSDYFHSISTKSKENFFA